jgi:hypothetical protein
MGSCTCPPTLVAGRGGRYQLVSLGVGKVVRHADAGPPPSAVAFTRGGSGSGDASPRTGKQSVSTELAGRESSVRLQPVEHHKVDPAETRYGVAVDVKRAADLYGQGWTLRHIGAELGVTATTVSHQLRGAGITMRRGGPPAHAASTQQIRELRGQGLTWSEVAQQVDMTVSGAWSRYRKARPTKPPRLAVGSGCFPTRWTKTLPLAYEQPSQIILVEPQPGLSSPLPDEPPTVSPPLVRPACSMCREPMQAPIQAIARTCCWRSRM